MSASKLGIAAEKVIATVHLHGNTSAASIPFGAVGGGRRRPHQGRATLSCWRLSAEGLPGARPYCDGKLIEIA